MTMACGPQPGGADKCSLNMAQIHLLAGDLVTAYKSALPGAEAGDPEAMTLLVQTCEQAGDAPRAQQWRGRLAAGQGAPSTP